jgi:hypothetical protein
MCALRLLRKSSAPLSGKSVTCKTVPTKTGSAEPPNPGHPNEGLQEQANAAELNNNGSNKAVSMIRTFS